MSTPAERLRAELATARRRGEEFDAAWAGALARALDGAPRGAEWAVALGATRPAWRLAYHGRGQRGLARAREMLELAEVAGEMVRPAAGARDPRLVA